jgi:Transmembrane secretion effector
MNKSSTWTALRNPAFRKLWIATVISGTCVAAYDSAATWMMNISTGSPFLLSLMSTVCFVNVGLAATPAGLAVLGWLHLLNTYLILVSVFLIEVGFAFDAPAWTSIVPQVVSDAELPSAATLSGLQFNISGIIGPMLGGFLVPLAGANFVFALNAACFLLVVQATHQWKPPAVPAKLPTESFFRIFQDGYPLYSLRARLSGRVGPKFPVCPVHFSDSGIDAGCGLSSSNLGLLFTSIGAGSVVGAVFIIPRLRASLRQLKAAVEYGQAEYSSDGAFL